MIFKIKLLLLGAFLLSFSRLSFGQEDYVDTSYHQTKKPKPIRKRPTYFLSNPDYTSYFLSPTAYTLSSRDFRLAANELLFYKCSYGITNKTTLSATGTLFGGVIASVKQKIMQNESMDVSFTAQLGDLYTVSEDTTILFTGGEFVATIGDYENNLSFSTGFHYVYSSIDLLNDYNEFFFHNLTIGYQKQLTRTIFATIEGIYYTNYNIFTGAGGFKFVIKRRYTLGTGVTPIYWNNLQPTRYDQTAVLLPYLTFRMLIERN